MGRQSLRWMTISLVGAALICFSPVSIDRAHALGLGGYISYGTGSVDFEESWDTEDPWARLENSGDVSHFGFGFLLDTAVAKNRIFNYRLQIGYEASEYDIDSVFNQETGTDISPIISDFKVDIDQIVFDNTFGFGIVRRQNFRLWIGPQIRIGYMTGDGQVTDILGTTLQLNFEGVVYGFAPVIGGNFNFNNNLSIGIDLGYRLSGMAGNIEKSGLGLTGADDYSGDTNVFFVNFSMIYRLNDDYY